MRSRHCALDSASVRDGDEVRLALERGWGVRLVARAGATSSTPPLEGVRVHVDGVVAGTTGPDGVFEVVRDAAPVRIEAELDGWRPLDHPLEATPTATHKQHAYAHTLKPQPAPSRRPLCAPHSLNIPDGGD